MPSQNARTAMLLGGALIAAIGGAALDGNPAAAEETAKPLIGQSQLTSGISYVDDHTPALHVPQGPSLRLSDDGAGRFANLNQFADTPAQEEERRAVEVEFAAPHDVTGIPLDFSIAQRASFGAGEGGDIYRHSRGSEVRVGRALGDPRGNASASDSRIYVFAASDDEALTWQPTGQDSRGFAFQQDRVEIGDMQAGITYERGPMQASIAYVEREVSATVGRTTFNNDENFAGFTLTMRR